MTPNGANGDPPEGLETTHKNITFNTWPKGLGFRVYIQYITQCCQVEVATYLDVSKGKRSGGVSAATQASYVHFSVTVQLDHGRT